MSDVVPTRTTTFFNTGHGDLTMEWDLASHDQMVVEFQLLMDKGVTFFKLEDQGKVRKKLVAVPTTELPDNRKLLIKDPDLAKLFESGLGRIARFETCMNLKTVGAARTAEEAASADTVAANAKVGG